VTALAVSIAVEVASDVPQALELARRSGRDGATLVEWRIDSLLDEEDALTQARRLLRESPLPSIVTCRPRWEGGAFDGTDQERVAFLEALGTGDEPPVYIDVELAAYQRSSNLRQKIDLVVSHARQARDVRCALILSTHDFDGRPPDLVRRAEMMQEEPACAIVKLAWRARSLRDNLEAFELLRHRRKPMIALCMGPFGAPSRILAPKFGGFLTFASAEGAPATAPGQLGISELLERYRFQRIGPRTRVYGVLGWPIEQSMSPLLHNAGFNLTDHDGVYLPLAVPPEWEHFTATLGALLDDPHLDFSGCSVTIPHKEHLVRFVRERGGTLDAAAEATGAANTLVIGASGAPQGLNSDAGAALETLLEEGGMDRKALSSRRIGVLGAGGAARAVCWALADAGAAVVVANRGGARAAQLAAQLDGRPGADGAALRVTAGEVEDLRRERVSIIVNCTPVGMLGGPQPADSPLPDGFPFSSSMIVFDTIYNPSETPLLRAAKAGGARAIGGRGMFIRQAAAQFEAWTGRSAPASAWRRMLDDAL
jgi:3-dehydroquinate dehydratase/shikimate dehydrogenase